MEMHQLRYVVAVSRAGNFSRAAEQCHVSQPSLSQQILKLEEELGERCLIARNVRQATPHGGHSCLGRSRFSRKWTLPGVKLPMRVVCCAADWS